MRANVFGGGSGNERSVPVIGQGTWRLTSGDGMAEARDSLRLGVELGMTHIDTAEMYGDGLSEEIVAQAIKGLPRQNLFVVSKVLPENASYSGTISACERSLTRLGLDYLDCYLLHWRGSHPLSETMRGLEELVAQGKIRSLGVSNFDVEDLEEAARYLTKETIACNQVLYHLHERGIERALLPYCRQRSIAVVGYTPFGKRALPTPDTESGADLVAVAQRHGASVAQVVLAFLTRGPGLFTIPKASRSEHVRENAGAGDLSLSEEAVQLIDKHFPAPKSRTPLAWS